MLFAIITWILFGLVVGILARAVVPGTQAMGLPATTVLGIVGSFVGGTLGNLIVGGEVFRMSSAGFIGSVLGAILVLVLAGLVGRGRGSHA